MPSTSPMILRVDNGSCSNAMPNSTVQTGIVYARIADRPAGICWTPKRISPFHAAMLNSASARTLPQCSRGIRIESPDSRAASNKPSAANGSVAPRKVSGASSVTPSFSTGQLHPQTKVNTATRKSPEAGRRRAARRAEVIGRSRLRRSWSPPVRAQAGRAVAVFGLVQRARLRHPLIAPDAAGKLGQARVEFVDVSLAPLSDLLEAHDAQVV